MSDPRNDLEAILRRMRMDLTDCQSKITNALELLAALPAMPDSRRQCPTCGNYIRPPLTMAEHIHYSHDGPEPPEWAAAEALAGLET